MMCLTCPDHTLPAGWLKDDKAFLVSDRYDIWSLDPDAGRAPVNVTGNGRSEGIRVTGCWTLTRRMILLTLLKSSICIGTNESDPW
ncbi:MAG: hypothetical protein MZV63_68935 [Marinilabiliales bacterium]|nr:hypothetical protein [Marinilabiliales bacterium]